MQFSHFFTALALVMTAGAAPTLGSTGMLAVRWQQCSAGGRQPACCGLLDLPCTASSPGDTCVHYCCDSGHSAVCIPLLSVEDVSC
jgi:hypothetical protein